MIRSIIQANKQCVGGFKCLDAEYGVCFESEYGYVALMICFWCSQVWVVSKVEGAGRYYTIGSKPQALLDEFLQSAGVSKPPDLHDKPHA